MALEALTSLASPHMGQCHSCYDWVHGHGTSTAPAVQAPFFFLFLFREPYTIFPFYEQPIILNVHCS